MPNNPLVDRHIRLVTEQQRLILERQHLIDMIRESLDRLPYEPVSRPSPYHEMGKKKSRGTEKSPGYGE